MSDFLGNIEVPDLSAPSGTFPVIPDYPFGHSIQPPIAIHQFGSANAKIEQRFLLGTGARRFTVRRSQMRESERIALRNFWEEHYGPYGAFTYNAPNDDGAGTTPYTCRFADEPLSWEFLSDEISSIGVTLIEIPETSPEYTLNSTLTRFPSSSLQTALLSQVQEIIPLVRIQVREADYPVIYVSDRRCTIGGQLYQARLLEFDGISQSIGNESDDAQFTFGNADRVMRELSNDTDLFRASLEFSLFHVGTGIKLDLWKGEIIDWQFDAGAEFRVTAADGMYELNLPYPTRRICRTCWKRFDDGLGCPFTGQSSGMDYEHFPNADPETCDKGYETDNGCLAHGMKRYFGGILAEPQGVRIKDNSTGTWGYGRSSITSVSLVAESIYDEVIPEIYTDAEMPVNCKIAAGREESDFYDALGIVGEGPLVFGSGHKLDGQYHHGYPSLAGLRYAQGFDPALSGDFFSLGQAGDAGGDWRKATVGGWTWKDNFAAGTAFLELRRKDEKGIQLTQVTGHEMQAVVSSGIAGWVWSGAGVRTQQILTNPIWIAVNMMLRARGLRFADAALAEQYFDVDAAIAAADVCADLVDKLIGSGTETQFKFRGVLQEEKPLRDWIQEVLMNCLGYYSFAFGKFKPGIRLNSSVVEAFTEGNILFQSLGLAPLRPAFNHLTANFGDEEFAWAANSVSVYDIDHAYLIGGAESPLFLKSNVNLSGSSSKSQAARIISTRLREELGGITPDQWKAARQLSFRTTVLALNTEPGMVCSLTHPDMPDGALNGVPQLNYGEFRVIGWKLNKDYSIDVQGRTTVDEMYDLVVGPKPADVPASPVPVEPPGWNQRATGGKSVAGQGNATGDPTLTELFVQDERNPNLYHRKIRVEFTPPPTEFNDTFPRRAQISTPQVQTTGGAIAGNQTFVVEVCSRADGKDGLASDNLHIQIPAGTNTNKVSFLCRLPAEATHYVIRVGPYVGRTYRLGDEIASPGTNWFSIEISDISSLNSASLSPDPRFHHVRVYYFYDGSPGVIRDAGTTSGPGDNELTFQPETPEAGDAKITVVLCSANAAETDRYPFGYSPRAELSLTKDSGNPSGANSLEILTGADDPNIPSGYVAFQFNRETVNHTSISGLAVVLSKDLPACGPYMEERAAHPGKTVETGVCTIKAGSLVVEVAREADPAVVGRILLIYTDDETPDSDLAGEIITAEGENALHILTPFNKGGAYSYAIVHRWWDLATPGESGNAWYHWFPIDHSRASLFGLGPVNLVTWRTPPRLAPPGTFYATAYARNVFGVGTRLTAGPKAMSHVPDDLLVNAIPNGPTILFGVEAHKCNAGIYQAEFRAKFFAPGTAGQFADLRTPEEGGTLVDDGETQLVRGGLFAAHFGAQYTHVTSNQGRWFYAFRLKNPGGWSLWSDGNDTPLYAKHYVDTEDESKTISGPAAVWIVSVAAGPQPNTVVVTASRPGVNGGRIWEWAVQIKDASTGAWRRLDANVGASVVKYDGSGISHSLGFNGSRITRDSGSGFGSATVGDLILFDVRGGGQFNVQHCQWGTVTALASNYVNVQGHFRPVGASDFRIKIVRPPWEWNDDGYLGMSGYWNQVFWDTPNVPGDVTTQLFYTSVPLPIPEGLNVADVQARVWFDNGYSRSDDDEYSEGGSGSFGYDSHGALVGLESDDHPQYLPLTGERGMTGAFKPAVVNLTDAATIATNASLASHFRVTLGGDRTLGTPTGATDGQRCIWEFKQDPTGNRKLTLSDAFDKGDFDITASIAPNKVDLMGAVYNASAGKWFITGFIKGYG